MRDGRAIDRAQARGGVDVGLDWLRHAPFIFGGGASSKRKVRAGAKSFKHPLTAAEAMVGYGTQSASKGMNPFIKKCVAGLLPVFLTLCFLPGARALTFNVTYDSSVTNIGPLAQVQTAFGAAAQTIQNLYTNSITVNVTVYGPNHGNFGSIGLGESYTDYIYDPVNFKYPQLTNALRAARTTAADSNSVASLPASDPTGGSQPWIVARAQAKALGVLSISPTDPTEDGEVGFATNVNYTFDPNNRAVSGKFDFIGVAEHELTEVIGRSTYGLSGSGYNVTYDLFRFTTNGVRSFDPNATNVYFSVNNGATALKYFNSDPDGDLQDWASSTPPDSFDAFVPSGNELILSSADLTALDIIGFSLNYAPPRLTGATVGSGSFQLSFTNAPGTSYTVLATTNISLSVSNWTVLGTTTETAAGQFQFTDTQAAANKARFYLVRLN